MSVTCSQIYQAAFCYDIDLIAVLQCISGYILSRRPYFFCNLTEPRDIHLAVKMACIAADRSILHLKEMLLYNDCVAARHRYEYITERCSLVHLHNLEAIHYRFHRLDRIHFGHYNLRSEALGSHCNTLSAPSVTCNNHILACNNEIRGTVDSIPYRLSRAITVVEKMLAVSIVYEHHRETQSLGIVELDEPEDTCSGLLASADHARNEVRIFRMHKIDKVTAVIDDYVRSHFKNPSYMGLIFLRSGIIPGEHIKTGLYKSCRHIVLGRERVAAGHIHLGTTRCEHLTQICSLCFEMNRKRHLLTLERKGLAELFLKPVQKRHMMSYPIYFQPAVLPELRISYFACHIMYDFMSLIPQRYIFLATKSRFWPQWHRFA